MNEIEKIINTFTLKEDEKKTLISKLVGKRIYNVVTLQNKSYISLDDGQMLIFNNVSEDLKNELKKIQTLSFVEFSDKSSSKSTKGREVIHWTNEELEFLKHNHTNYSCKELEEKLNKSAYQIEAKKMNLKLYSIKPWTDEEISYLRENFTASLYDLSEILNRSIASIKAKKRIILKENSEIND